MEIKLAKKLEVFQSKFKDKKKELEREEKEITTKQQLNKLFDEISFEFYELQNQMKILEKSKNRELKDQIKKEIVEKISELWKISKMMESLKNKNKKSQA